jgi:SAM-dependent methyltransferase
MMAGTSDETWTTRSLACAICGDDGGTTCLLACDHREGLPGTFTIVECARCRLARTDPIPVDLSPWYPETYGNHAQRQAASVRLTLAALVYLLRTDISPFRARAIARLAPGGDLGGGLPLSSRILDVGAGNGSAVAAMRAAGFDAWGIEPSATGVRNAQAKGIETVRHGTLKSSGLADESWDLVRFTHVLEHVDDPVEELTMARDALLPGGRVAVLVPNFGSLGRRMFGGSWGGLEVPRHLWHFTPASLRATFDAAGLRPTVLRSAALFGVTSASIDAKLSGGSHQRGWGTHIAARAVTYPYDLLTAALGFGDGIVGVGVRATEPVSPNDRR